MKLQKLRNWNCLIGVGIANEKDLESIWKNNSLVFSLISPCLHYLHLLRFLFAYRRRFVPFFLVDYSCVFSERKTMRKTCLFYRRLGPETGGFPFSFFFKCIFLDDFRSAKVIARSRHKYRGFFFYMSLIKINKINGIWIKILNLIDCFLHYYDFWMCKRNGLRYIYIYIYI